MVLPAILGGLASGIGGGVASGLFGLFGGGSKNQSQSFDAQSFLNNYASKMKDINSDLIKYFDDKTTEYENQLSKYKQDYSNDQTKTNFKSNYQTYLDQANKAVDTGALSGDQAWSWFQDLANNSGLTLGSTINSKGNTLLDVKTAFDTKKLANMEKNWSDNLNTTFNEFLGRNATKEEQEKYTLKDYQNIENVFGSLARNNKEFYARNLDKIDPNMYAAKQFFGSGPVYDNEYARFGLDPSTGKPLSTTSSSTTA